MQQVVSPMTVYTVIGYITNAILTFEPLQIRSNLSGGPQLGTHFEHASILAFSRWGSPLLPMPF